MNYLFLLIHNLTFIHHAYSIKSIRILWEKFSKIFYSKCVHYSSDCSLQPDNKHISKLIKLWKYLFTYPQFARRRPPRRNTPFELNEERKTQNNFKSGIAQLWITFRASGYSISRFLVQMQWVTTAKINNNTEMCNQWNCKNKKNHKKQKTKNKIKRKRKARAKGKWERGNINIYCRRTLAQVSNKIELKIF